MSHPEPPLRRIMALDLGARRVGVALSDETRTLATPFKVVIRTSFAALLDQLSLIATAQDAGSLLVGLPLSLNGDSGPQARHVTAEAERIAARLQLPLVMWDERLSTVNAELLLAEAGHSGWDRNTARRGASRPHKLNHKRPSVDAVAAAMILQEYLDVRRSAAPGPGDEGLA